MSTRSIGALAGHGWAAAANIAVTSFKKDDDDMCFEKLLEKVPFLEF